MSAKNTAVNLMILSTFLSFLLYRRANIRQVVPWAKTGTRIQAGMFVIAAAIVLFFGIRGYFVEAIVRIGYSVYQVGAVLACIIFVTVIDVLMARGAQSLGAIQWGKMPPRSQYALFILAVTFTWLMGLMGFARSGNPPALARVSGDAGHDALCRHAGVRLCGDHDQYLRADLPLARRLHLLARGTCRAVDVRASTVEAPHVGQ